ncbi:MAG: DUF3772 domain-containing protein [Pseudomonadota bacterium]
MTAFFTRILLVLTLALCTALPPLISTGTAQAQEAPQLSEAEPNYDAWLRTADRADEAIEAARASTTALESLREDLVGWRQEFLDAQSINANALATVRRQINDLGPVPEDGAEPEDVAANRQLLQERLDRLNAPVLRAELAHSRADGLIQGIDKIIRDRQAEELLEFGPSPLNPAHWPEALAALPTTVTHISSEFSTAWNNPVQAEETRRSLPVAAVLMLLGLVLVFRGRIWSRRITNRVLGDDPGAGLWIAGFIASLGSLVLPFAGILFLVEATFMTGLVGLRGDQILSALLPAAFAFLLARWLATRVFPADEARTLPLILDRTQRSRGRLYGASLGLVAAAAVFLSDVGDISNWSTAAKNVVLFPVLVAAGLLLWRLANLLRAHVRNSTEGEGEENYRTTLIRLLALGLVALSFVAPLLAAVGYFRLAEWLMLPSLASLELLAVLLVLQRLVVEVYVLITGNREGAADSLIPILIGFLLVLMSLPVLALIWGARVADLTELWTQVLDGISIGGVRISPMIFLTFALVFVLGYLATRMVQGALKNTILPKTRIDPGGRNAIVSGVGYLGIFLAAVIAITSAGIDLSSIAIVAGALSVGIGFGLQNIVSNFVSGIILLIERPISEGDWIEVGGVHGTVRDISVRSTIIQTFDRSDVIVPNSDLVSGRVTNYTRGNTVGRVIVPVGVAYGTDTKKVEAILQEVADAHPLVLMNPPPAVLFRSFGASSLDFEIRAILRDVNYVLSVHSEMNHEIAKRFEEEGIEVPFAQRDIWIRNPEALGSSPSDVPGTPAAPSKDTSAHMTQDDLDLSKGDGDGDGDGGGR